MLKFSLVLAMLASFISDSLEIGQNHSLIDEGCGDFTLGRCDPQAIEVVGAYPGFVETSLEMVSVCQELCNNDPVCNYWRYSDPEDTCYLLRYVKGMLKVGTVLLALPV